MRQDDVYLALGSNLGERRQNLDSALAALQPGLLITRVSSVYETEPVGYSDQSPFLNLVCRASTDLSPEGVHRVTLGAEKLLLGIEHVDIGANADFQPQPGRIERALARNQCLFQCPDL